MKHNIHDLFDKAATDTGKGLVGKKIKVIKAEKGAWGANEEIGIVLPYDTDAKHGKRETPTSIKIKIVESTSVLSMLADGATWDIGEEENVTIELL